MMTGRHHGERLGACTDCRRFWAQYRAGKLDEQEISEIEGKLATTAGTCAVMGTASTMACLVEALGMILPGTAAIPAVHADRLRAAEATGALAVKLIGSKLTPDKIINQKSIENALRVLLAIGGSTNAIIHLTAIAGRAGVPVSLEAAQRIVRHHAGAGEPEAGRQRLHGGLLRRRRHGRADARIEGPAASRRHDGDRRDARRAARRRRRGLGRSHHHRARARSRWSRRAGWWRCSAIWRRRARSSSARPPTPICSRWRAGRWCLPRSRISPRASTIPISTSTPNDILVLQNAGPHSPSAMPEAGYLPIPKKLAAKGVKDMVRISDARMSGTAFGTIVLHVTPDSGVRRPARPGAQRRPHPALGQEAPHRSAGRRGGTQAPRRRRQAAAEPPARGYARLYAQEILGADQGCDFAFLKPR